MKKIVWMWLLLTVSFSSFAVNNYTSGTGVVVMPDVSVDGKANFDSVTMQLDFTSGTFKILGAVAKNTAISSTPLQTFKFNSFIVDFLGCQRSGTNEITCYTNITNTGNDAGLQTGSNGLISAPGTTLLYDDLSQQYGLSSVTVQNNTGGLSSLTYIQGIPVMAAYKFTGFNIHATAITRFQPWFSGGGNANFTNITIQ